MATPASEKLIDLALRAAERGWLPRRLQKRIWKNVYSTVNTRWPDENWHFMNYGYVPDNGAEPLLLAPDDERQRPFIALYHQALDDIPVAGRRVLEVGCGRGGGVSYIARYMSPQSAVGLDLSPMGIAYCRKVHAGVEGLTFAEGDAERMPFENQSFDVVVSIESSHCYPDMAAFVSEVARVLAPGGDFAWSDLRSATMMRETQAIFDRSRLEPVASRAINRNVVRALDELDDQKLEIIDTVPLNTRVLRQVAGTRGSVMYKALSSGQAVYATCAFRKPS